MKFSKYFFLFVAGLIGCAVYSQKPSEVVRVEFTSLARGGYNKQVIVTKDSLFESNSEGREEVQIMRRKTNPNEWQGLMQSLNNVTLSKIPDLKSPTMKRAYDGARHSTISISTSRGETVTHSFDDEMPNEKLQELMKLIIGFKR